MPAFSYTAQKLKFSFKDLFSKCDQIRSFVKESLMENFSFCAVLSFQIFYSVVTIDNDWCLLIISYSDKKGIP